MELTKNTLNHLITYLQAHGYPDSTFAVEYRVGKFRIDLAIIDPETKLPIQIFELKSRNDAQNRKMGTNQLKTFLNELKTDIPAYLVFPKSSNPFFEIEICSQETTNQDGIIAKDEELFFNFQFQKQARVKEQLDAIKDKKETTIDHFKWVCWAMAMLLFGFIILQKFNCISVPLDYDDLIIVGAIIVLVLLPFTSKINILGVEINRLENRSK